MSAELKACPFCGGQAKSEETICDGSVRCQKCNAKFVCNHGRVTDDGLADAIAAWNRRTDLTPPAADYVAGMIEASRIADEKYAAGDMGNPGHHIRQASAASAASPDTRVDVETLAAALWREESVNAGAPASVTDGRTIASFADQSPELRARWIKFASCAIRAIIGGQDRG